MKQVVARSWEYFEWADGSRRPWEEPEEPDPPDAPEWATELTIDEWDSIGENSFADVAAANVGQYGSTGPASVFTAWCGSAHVPEFGQAGSILHWGGGHADYYGNEVYAFDLASRLWARLNEPSTAGNADSWSGPYTNGILSDGTPNVPHTYFFLVARDGKLVTAHRQITSLPSVTSRVSIFDPVEKTWWNSTEVASGVAASFEEGVCYDTARDGLWQIQHDALEWAFYDFGDDEWTSYQSNASAYSPGANAVYVPGRDAVICFPTQGPFGLDPSSPSDPGNNEVTLTISGSGPSITTGSCVRWSENLGALVYYPRDSNQIWLLTAPGGDWKSGTWTWSQRSLSGSSGNHDGAGTWGKFHVIEWGALTIALVAGDVDGPVAVVRLA